MKNEPEQLELPNVEVPPTIEELSEKIHRLSKWIENAEVELKECVRCGMFAFELKERRGSTFDCYYIRPQNEFFNDKERLHKYWLRVVKSNIRTAKKMLAETKIQLAEICLGE